jgi:hypothetical protein
MLDQENSVPGENSKSTEDNNSTTSQFQATKKSLEAEHEVSDLKEEVLKIENVAPEVKLIENKAVEEIENKIAESSEEREHSLVEMLDYSKFTLEDLVAELGKLVKEGKVQSINNNVNKIKSVFNVKFGALLKKEKEKFIAEGGNSIDFHYENPLKLTYNSYLYDYKIKKKAYFEEQEKQLKDNLEAKLEIIEELKNLIETADDGAVMYKMFKDIQAKWNQVGPIPRAKYNDTWRTYHHHVERFYDLLHISNDLRDLDFKHNLEEKLKLVEKAEELTTLEDVNFAFKELQVLHKLWKEDIGPVAREYRDEVWDRFSEATKKVHDKRHDFFKDLKSKYEENIDVKLAIIDKIAAVDTSTNKTRVDWQKSIKEVESLRDEFFKSGQIPRTKSDKIWAKFKEATRKFNIEKNKYFKEVKRDHLDNLNKKKLLIEQANSLKDSEDWEMTTEVMKKIQADWKKIGHVPRKYSDKLWKEFKDACNHYFDRLHQNQDAGNKEQLEVFNKKKELLKTIKEEVGEGDDDVTIDTLKEYVDEWRNLGRVPYEMKHIEVKFNKLIDKIVDENDAIDKPDIEMIKFTNMINSYLEQKNYRKLDSEQLFIRKKIDESVREIQQLENNLGFISNVTKDNPLVKNVRKQIDSHKEKLEVWKTKLQYLKDLDY